MFRHCATLSAPTLGENLIVVPEAMPADSSWLSVTLPVPESIPVTMVFAGIPDPVAVAVIIPTLIPLMGAPNCNTKSPADAAAVVVSLTLRPGSVLIICCTAVINESNGGGVPSAGNWNEKGFEVQQMIKTDPGL